MLSRRMLRIKVLHMLYAYIKSGNDSIKKAEKELFYSIDKTYDLYFYILLFIIELGEFAEDRIDLARKKNIPTYQDLNPNTKFIDNRVLRHLKNNNKLYESFSLHKISWVKHPELVKRFYKIFITTDLYQSYMNDRADSFQVDLQFVTNVLNQAVMQYDDLHIALEEDSIYWNDDIEYTISFICKSLKQINQNVISGYNVVKLFKNEDDIEFTKKLVRKSILNYDEHKKLIDKYASNWDIDRIAFMDILILSMALTEIIEFPSIPIKVSFNEYLEISKIYSTKNSSSFINGILDKIVKKLKEDKIVVKQGRGLVGEV